MKLTLEVKDKNGVKLIELDPEKKYILVMNKDAGADFFKVMDNQSTLELGKYLGSNYVFIVDDVNQVKLEETKHFLKILRREERKAKKS